LHFIKLVLSAQFADYHTHAVLVYIERRGQSNETQLFANTNWLISRTYFGPVKMGQRQRGAAKCQKQPR
jgi:hypothetical protein